MSPMPHQRNLPVSSTGTIQHKAQRSAKACACCHVRKIRCDVAQVGFPCSKCRADGFECVAHSRKRRQKKTDAISREREPGMNSLKTPSSIPEHVMRHKLPFYSFFRNFTPRGQPWLHARDPDHGVLLPVPMHDQTASYIRGDKTEMAEDLQFLKLKGALELPPRESLDQFVSSYFRLFHPFFPIIDRQAFLAQYRQTSEDEILSGHGPSLLLLQAIVFTASSTVPIEAINSLGFPARKHARSALHKRIRYLYNFDYESDDITIIQALLLMSHYFPSVVDQRHTWLWVHQAISLAQGAGLHRDSGQAPQRKLWARIWWACLIRDRLITLGTGRPMHINSLDCNVPLLSISDLEEDGDERSDLAVKSIFVEFAKLCQYMEGVFSLPLAIPEDLPQQVDLCRKTLEYWKAHLDTAATRSETPGFEDGINSIAVLYRGVLHLVYNTLTIILCQSGRILDGNHDTNPRAPSLEVQLIAEDSTQLAAELMKLDVVGCCPTICVTSILPPLVIHLQTLRPSYHTLNDSRSRSHFQTCMKFLHQLGEVYWHADFYHDFFEIAASSSLAGPAQGTASVDQVPPVSSSSRQTQMMGQLQGEDKPKIGTKRKRKTGPIDHNAFLTSTPSDLTSMDPLPPSNLDELSPAQDQRSCLQGPPSVSREFFEQNDEIFTNWLDDYAFFQNLFPSA